MSTADQIVAAARTAAEGTGLKVQIDTNMNGALVIGRRVQAHVFPTSTGFQVEMWRGDAKDAFSIVPFTSLDAAAAAAIEGCA